MRACSFIAITAILVGVGIAHAGPKQDIQAKIKEAMENVDLMDYDAARKLLNQALTIAKKSKLEKDPQTAKAYLSLGIISFIDKDQDAAKLSFMSAVQIDPKIQIDAGYKTADMAKLLDHARTEASGGGAAEPAPPAASGPDCSTVQGLQHTIIDSGKTGTAIPIEALVASDVAATKIAVMYRVEGATEFTEIKLKKEGECKYTGSIPGAALKGALVHYYVAALNDVNKPIASKGSSGSPNIIELTAGSGPAAPGDIEDPIAGGGGGGGGGSVSTNVTVGGPKRQRIMIAVAGGAGSGYVSGETEGENTVKNCCLGGPIIVLQPEIGYFVNQQLSIGIAARIGIPVGANVDPPNGTRATAAPGGVVRVRYALAENGEGLRFMGQVGAGVMRNTIKLDNSMPGMDTDIVAQGPLLIGGGVGFTKRLSSVVSVIADLSALAGIAIVETSSLSPKLNSGFGADLSLGIQLGF